MERAGAKGRPLSILPTLAAAFGWSYSYTTLLNVVIAILQFASPQIVSLLINFVTSDEPTWRGYLYTVLIVAVTLLTTFLNVLAFYQGSNSIQYPRIFLKFKVACTCNEAVP